MNDSDQFLLDFQDRELPSLDNFIVGSNTEVVGILRELQLGMGPTFVYIHKAVIQCHDSSRAHHIPGHQQVS